jgi:hypothetical protein
MLITVLVQILVAAIIAYGIYVLFFERRPQPPPEIPVGDGPVFLESGARVAHSLDSLRGQVAPRGVAPGIDAALAVSQEEIARLAGLSRYRTREALRLLERRGVVRLEHVGLTILDPQALADFGVPK